MKKFLSYIMIIIIMIFLTPNVKALEDTYYTNLAGIGMTRSQYDNLIALGFNEEFIDCMDATTFNNNKDIDATLLGHATKYYKTVTTTVNGIKTFRTTQVTQEEAERERNTRSIGGTYYSGFTETTYKRLVTSIAEVDDLTMRYMTTLTWLQMPSTRSHDIIATGVQQYNVSINLPIYFGQNYKYASNNVPLTSGYGTPKRTNLGAGATFKLPSGNINLLTSFIYFNVVKQYPNSTVTSLQAAGDYAHATSSISNSNAQKYAVSHGSGIILDDSIEDYYDAIIPAIAEWYGSW